MVKLNFTMIAPRVASWPRPGVNDASYVADAQIFARRAAALAVPRIRA